MLKWHYPCDGCGKAGSAIGPIGVATAPEYDGDGIGILTIRYVFETFPQIVGRDDTDERVEDFLVLTSRLVFPFTDATFVMKIRIGKVQGRNTTYKELCGQNMDQKQAFC